MNLKAFATLLLVLISITSTQSAYNSLKCNAFRISQDKNQNLQKLIIDGNTVKINGLQLSSHELTQGGLSMVHPSFPEKATFISKATSKEYKFTINYLEHIKQFQGVLDLARDHEVEISKVKITVKTSSKTQAFIGVCTSEVITTCGGACANEFEERDVL